MISTQRLIIRPFLETDYQDLYEYLSRKETYRFERGEPISLEKAQEFAHDWSKGTNFWAATLKTSLKLIGHISLFPERPAVFRTWQIGYIFNPDFHNLGYASEATLAVIKYTFSELGAHRIVACCSPDNIPSWKVMEKCGMKKEGLSRKDFILRDDENGKPVWLDSYTYAILDEDMA
jgi:[ribosomal protein S5]-alanine N-acetyltransferase